MKNAGYYYYNCKDSFKDTSETDRKLHQICLQKVTLQFISNIPNYYKGLQ